jgi:hypothetical protein
VEAAAVHCDDCNPGDSYGRDAAERTVELNQPIAAAACAVVDDERCSLRYGVCLSQLCDPHHGSQLNGLVLVLQVAAYRRLIAGISAVTQAFDSVNADQDFVFGVRFVRGEKIAQSRSGFGAIDSLQGSNSRKDRKSVFAARDRHR